LKSEIEEMQRGVGQQQTELSRLCEEGNALALQQAIESHRGQLREHVERYAALMLAEKALQAAIERFQRDHQPAVLEEARRLFAQMTNDEHVDVRHDAHDSFWIVDRFGHERRPQQLSRGTQEQLYLAFRLAYVKHYCRDSEPLPLVMDDVLVDFDAHRQGQTLAALFDLSRDIQIIFLTCNSLTVDLVKQHCPTCNVLELSRTPLPV
jgi:uncharacterized protein YhaN